MPPVEPTLRPADGAQRGVRLLLGADHDQVGRQLALVGSHRPYLAGAVADEGLELGVEVHLHAHLGPGLLDRCGDVGVGGLGERPRVVVDQVGLDAPVGQRGHHLQPERRGLDDDGHLGVVEDLVPLDGLADVLDVVEALEVGAGHAGVGVVEAGAEDQPVPGHVALAGDGDRPLAHVEAGDRRLVADVDPRLFVRLLAGEEQRLEVGDLLAVHVGDAARAVGRVLVLGVDDDLGVLVGAPGRSCRTDAGGTTTDDDDLHRGHLLLVRRGHGR